MQDKQQQPALPCHCPAQEHWPRRQKPRRHFMQALIKNHCSPLFLSVLVHALVVAIGSAYYLDLFPGTPPQKPDSTIIFLEQQPTAAPQYNASPAPEPIVPPPEPAGILVPPDHAPASMPAPPAPSAQEWAFAANYTLKNSKPYRYNWGQQVRSMMGTAIEGPDQGVVRFRVEIAPDGTLARLETLWTTSVVVEERARKAIEAMPALPPTPTGKPLVFERTISFQPFDTGWPPDYKNDCLPDPPKFSNPFAWDGKAPRTTVTAAPPKPAGPDPQALQECLDQLPQETIDSVSGAMNRQFERWTSDRMGR
jgi:hypothetical protein